VAGVFENWDVMLFALGIFALGIASPGPVTLVIFNTAVLNGRSQAISLALGCALGSIIWGLIAAITLSSPIDTSSLLFALLKFLVGVYLLHLAVAAFRRAKSNKNSMELSALNLDRPTQKFLHGLTLKLLTPTTPILWVIVFTVLLESTSGTASLKPVVFMCALIGVIVYMGYAYVFSTKKILNVYLSSRGLMDFAICGLYCFAAVNLLCVEIQRQTTAYHLWNQGII